MTGFETGGGSLRGVVPVGREVDGGDGLDAEMIKELWTAEEVVLFLRLPSVRTLYEWRYMGKGPQPFRVGRYLLYDPRRVSRWLLDECLGKAG